GERVRGLELLAAVNEGNRRIRDATSEMVLSPWVARALFMVGRCRAGRGLLDSAHASAARAGVQLVTGLVERTRRWDPLPQLEQQPAGADAGVRPSEAVRVRALAALQAARAGDAEQALTAVAGDAELVRAPGYALERAIAELVRGVLAEREGRESDARLAYAAAEREAAAEGVDADLVPAL